LGDLKAPEAVEPLLSILRAEAGEEMSGSVAEALGKIADLRAVLPLLLFSARRGGNRFFCIGDREVDHALGKIFEARTVQEIADEFKHQGIETLVHTFEGLSEIAVEHAVKPLCAGLKHPNGLVRRKAAEAMVNVRDARAAGPLCVALKDSDEDVRRYAAEALGKIGAPAVMPLLYTFLDREAELGKTGVAVLRKMGEPVVGSLCDALKASDERVRRCAAVALGKIGDGRAVQALCDALKDAEDYVRLEAAEAVGNIGDAQAVEPLCEALKDRGWAFRYKAAEALGKIGDARAVEPLIAALKNTGHERESAIKALGEIGWQPTNDQNGAWYWIATRNWYQCAALGEAAVEPLCATLKMGDEDERQSVAETLGTIGDAWVVEPLCAALTDVAWRVCVKAAEALGKIGDARAVEPLCTALRGKHRYARQAAARGLVSLYESGNLGDSSKRLILAQRENMAESHTDHTQMVSSDCGEHTDRGIGVDFPI